MADKPFRFGPVVLAAAVANIFHMPAAAAGGVNIADQSIYAIIRHIRIVNTTAAAVAYGLYICATGLGTAGKEFMGSTTPVPAYGYVDWYGMLRLDNGATEFLTGVAGSTPALTIEGEGVLAVG